MINAIFQVLRSKIPFAKGPEGCLCLSTSAVVCHLGGLHCLGPETSLMFRCWEEGEFSSVTYQREVVHFNWTNMKKINIFFCQDNNQGPQGTRAEFSGTLLKLI